MVPQLSSLQFPGSIPDGIVSANRQEEIPLGNGVIHGVNPFLSLFLIAILDLPLLPASAFLHRPNYVAPFIIPLENFLQSMKQASIAQAGFKFRMPFEMPDMAVRRCEQNANSFPVPISHR